MTNSDATANELRRMLKSCPACAGTLENHSYVSVAVTVATPDNKERLHAFCGLLKAHDWPALMKFDDFDPMLNALEVFAVKCVSGAIVLLAVRNPFELLELSETLDCEMLDSTTGHSLSTLVESDRWRPLSPVASAA